MIIEDILEFFRNTPPFQFLDAAALQKVAESVIVEFYPKGFTILTQDGPPSEFLQVVKKGVVKVSISTPDSGETVIDFRSEGDAFGFLSLVSGDRSRTNVTAAADTICYLLDRKSTLRLMDTQPSFTEFFLKSFFNVYVEKTHQETQSRSLLGGSGDLILFTTPVRKVISRKVITASASCSIQEAADTMARHQISSLVLTDATGEPCGIVTDRDLRDKVVARARDVNGPLAGVMTDIRHTAEASEYCFEVVLRMIRHGIHHLPVFENGLLVGIVTNHDLMVVQGSSPIALVREIEKQQSVAGLAPMVAQTDKFVAQLLKQGARAGNITRVMSEVNDRVQKKLLELAEQELGPPPLPYCWVVFGSEGRKEQTFRTDQDNALIYGDPESPEKAQEAESYFTRFATVMEQHLVRCGVPPCPAGYMASNPRWRQPLKVWKDYCVDWVSRPVPEAILLALIFFDFRPLSEDPALADELRDHLERLLRGKDIFFVQMATTVVMNRPPLGIFGNFVVDREGDHRDTLNIKVNGLAPLVNIARLYALQKGVSETSTVERLRILRERHDTLQEFGEELEQAFEFLMLLRLHHQFEQMEAGLQADNFINPDRLSNLEKKGLKDAFKVIGRMQDLIAEIFRTSLVA